MLNIAGVSVSVSIQIYTAKWWAEKVGEKCKKRVSCKVSKVNVKETLTAHQGSCGSIAMLNAL